MFVSNTPVLGLLVLTIDPKFPGNPHHRLGLDDFIWSRRWTMPSQCLWFSLQWLEHFSSNIPSRCEIYVCLTAPLWKHDIFLLPEPYQCKDFCLGSWWVHRLQQHEQNVWHNKQLHCNMIVGYSFCLTLTHTQIQTYRVSLVARIA